MFPLTSAQFVGLNASGAPLASGKVYTYLAGTTTPAATYTTEALSTANSNPVVLNSAGRASIWLDPDVTYRIVLKTANDETVYDVDNISSGVAGTVPSASVEFTQSGASSAVTLESKLQEVISVRDFGAVGDGVTDDTAAIQAAVDYAGTITGSSDYTATGVGVFFPAGDYLISSTITITSGGIGLFGNPARGPRIITNEATLDMFTVGDSGDTANNWEVHFSNLLFYASNVNNAGVVGIRVYRSFMGSVRWCAFENCYEGIVGHRMNRWTLHGCRFWQNRTTQIAASSVRMLGMASGNGGGIHISDCEFAGGGSLVPSVDAHLLIESCDGLYVVNSHTRDCNHAVKVNPDGTATKNVIDSLFFSNCYFDENYLYNVWLTGSVSSGGRYQVISFDGCYFRGTGGESTNCVRVGVSDGGSFTGDVFGFTFNGGSMRQADSTAALIQGSSNSFLEVYGVCFAGVYFDDNNFGGAATTTAIQCEAETLTVTGCTFGQDITAGTQVVQANLSGPNSSEPSFVAVGNDFSKNNCSSYPIDYTQSSSGTSVTIEGNAFPGLGRSIDQTYKLASVSNTPANIWTFVIAQGSAGFVDLEVAGSTNDGGRAAVYTWSAAFRRDGGGSALDGGAVTAGRTFAYGTPVAPTFALSTNTLTAQVASPAAITAGSFVTGRRYQILTVGTTNFTTIGASASTVGVQFTATGAGTGTGTAVEVMDWAARVRMTVAR